MKKIFKVLLCLVMTVQLAACGSSSGNSTLNNNTNNEVVGEQDGPINSDTFELEDASIKYVGVEKAIDGVFVYDNGNNYIFKFDYVNNSATPASAKTIFTIKFFQNGVELDGPNTYTNAVSDYQYSLLSGANDDVMGGGKLTVGYGIKLEDDSPVTIYMKKNGSNVGIVPVSYTVEIK